MILYRSAGFPVALRRRLFKRPERDALDQLRNIYGRHYWHPRTERERKVLRKGLLRWPAYLLSFMFWFTRLNGRLVARQYGRPVILQLLDQLHYYFRYGILPRWYYIFSLYEPDGPQRARGYINRFETKLGGVYSLLNRGAKSPLNDKVAFARHCAEHGLRAAPVL